MTIFKDLQENVPVNKENLTNFIEQYSPEIVQGYMMAIQDMFQQIEAAAFHNPPTVPNSSGKVRKLLIELYSEKHILLNSLQELGINNPNTDIKPKS